MNIIGRYTFLSLNLPSDFSSEVEQSTHYPKVVGSNLGTIGTRTEKIAKGLLKIVSSKFSYTV